MSCFLQEWYSKREEAKRVKVFTSCWASFWLRETDNNVSIVSIVRMRKKRRDDCHLSELSFSRVNTNLNEDQNCFDIWRRDYSSLLRFAEWVENVIEAFIFLLIQTWEWYWKIYEWLSFIALKSRYSCKIHAVEAQEVCECQDAKFNWSIHTTEFWLQHLQNTSAKTVLSTFSHSNRLCLLFSILTSLKLSCKFFQRCRFWYLELL